MRVEERLLKYVSYWTTSDEECRQIPSSERQFELGKVLEQELRDLGLEKVTLTDHCYVYGLLPATKGYADKPAVGFISHMDTAPDFSGKDVKPQIIPDYDGNDVLLKGSGAYLKISDFPTLKTLKGRTLITTDGTTLLGADDKAGVSEIMTAVEQIITEKIPHGDIWIGFTPDEEVGSGADLFDLDYFKAKFAYTVDGDYEGEVAYENFNAASASFEITGVNVHPGEAKDIMINAALVGCEIASLLPENETPAHTEGREGFYHLTDFSGDIAHAKVNYIVRDHDKATFEKRLDTLRGIEKKMNEKYHADTVKLNIQHSYSNMLEVIEKNEYVVAIAKKAIKNVGLEPVSRPVRGGTDGARLSFMGLPCPNLGTGGYGFHGPFEHISVEGMDTAVSVIKEIVKITAE
ncbi:peptidase T [Roseburia inulinivorans]|jgi:tripeptide aminopeptidase|uniref:Peptidase T n=1 Tax=Roseburia inulinivorans TaxID=360807 RepID=A0A3R5Z285_9FIRM|nr:peptidase T [Roseburia inulinivorans]RGQ49551.1 peptidase T [Roseburia inulinivorans]RGR68311.1 peptidase T [Roseburia inulinivorans]RGS66480.1 peptidase T [Roseburia inulinivorans]RHF82754.1 peptidase T [Roseburia inulinivorans]